MYKLTSSIGLSVVLILFSLSGCVSYTGKKAFAALKRGDLCEAIALYESQKERDSTLLREIAEAVIEREAKSSDSARRDAAFAQLKLAGTGARRVLERLTQGNSASIPRAKALEILVALGDKNAEKALGKLAGASEAEIVAASLAGLDIESEKHRVLSALHSTSPLLRRKAARLLAALSSETDVRLSLVETVKRDPDPAVRSAAITSVSKHAVGSLDIIKQMVSDPNLAVKLAAIRVLVRTNYKPAESVLDEYLNAEASDEGIEVARVLIAERVADKSSLDRALHYLYRALCALDPTTRAHAAVALDGLSVDLIHTQTILARLEKEEIPAVRLPLAMTLLSLPQAQRAVIRALLELMKQGGVEGAQAGAELAALGDRKALWKTINLRDDPSVPIRRVAVRLISRRLGHPDKVAKSLCDTDPFVRIIAAGAILAVLASNGT